MARLSIPASSDWTLHRVLTLIQHFFDRNTHATVVEAMAEDWAAILAPYPSWAITNACRWWLGADNPKRRQRPMPGDIAEAAHRELAVIRAAELRLKRTGPAPRAAGPQPLVGRDVQTPKERADRRAAVDAMVKELFPSNRGAQ